MAELNQQRIGNRTSKRNLRVVIGKAIDFLVSVTAILLTQNALTKFLQRCHQADKPLRVFIKTGPNSDETRQQRIGHQASEINLRVVTWAAIGLMVSVIAVFVTVGGLFSIFTHQNASKSAPLGIATSGRLPPAPRLQTNPASDLQQLLQADNAKLDSYGWVDRSAGVIRIPIERAMDLVAERGLPARGDDGGTGNKTPLQMRQEKAGASNP
jgi:hypothetical protein